MLGDQIESAKRSVNTDTVQITVGEVATMYKDRELDIIPDFNRDHCWRSGDYVQGSRARYYS